MTGALNLLVLEGPAEREWLAEAAGVVTFVTQHEPVIERRAVETLTREALAALKQTPADLALVSMWLAIGNAELAERGDAEVDALLTELIEGVQARGGVAALCTLFRHVAGPRAETQELRERIRVVNLRARRLSQRTGCFVFDLDRVLSHTGGASLQADVHGGGGEAVSSMLLDELVVLLPEMLGARPTEAA
ncbi:MAG: hypothetical protein JST92_08630 [Deltaproteobacteria bacterium]|nr:hypothetical protein [Deltaproteobacteria bacterium]